MNTQVSPTSVRTSVTVDAPVERAFTVFTNDMGAWWDPDHHLVEGGFESMELEPYVGGRIIDHGRTGETCSWARVLAYDPPTHFAFSWDITLQWEVETDHARTSEVHVTFTPEGDGRTRVDLEHRHIERHGDGWEGMRDAVGAENGWSSGLKRYAAHIG